MPFLRNQPLWTRYGIAFISVSLTFMLIEFMPAIGEWRRGGLLLPFFAIIAVTFWLGQGPGWFTGLLAIVLMSFTNLRPIWIESPNAALLLNIVFILLSVLTISTIAYQEKILRHLFFAQQDLKLAQSVGIIGSWRLQLKSSRMTWSDELYRIFGIPLGTTITREVVMSRLHPDDIKLVETAWKKMLNGQTFELEHRIIVNGDTVWLHVKGIAEPSKNTDAIPAIVFGIVQDITEHKQVTLKLQEQDAQLNLIMNLTPSLQSYLSTDLRYQRVNRHYENWWKLKPDQILGRSVREIVGDKNWLIAKPYLDKALTGEQVSFDHHLKLRDDSLRWVCVTLVPDIAKNGDVKGIVAHIADIEERMQQQKMLRESKERMRLATEATGVGIWEWNAITNKIGWDKQMFQIYGLSPSQDYSISSDLWLKTVVQEDLQDCIEAGKTATRIPASYTQEFRIVKQDNSSVRCIQTHFSSLLNDQGEVEWILGTNLDITDQKAAAIALAEQEHQIRLIMNLTPNLIAYLSLDFRYVRINKTYESWWNKTPEQILGLEVRQLVGEEAWRGLEPYMQRARSGESVSFDFHSPSGRWVHVDYVPDVADSGTVNGIVVNVANITEQKIALKKIQESENQLQLIMDMMPAIISYVDTDFRYLRVNKVYEQWFGMAMKDLIGRTPREVIGEQAWKVTAPLLERARKGETVSEEHYATYEKVSRWTKKNFVPVKDESGAVKGIVIHIEDITEDKNHELQLIEKENFLKLIINTMPALVAYVSPDYRYVRANKTYEKWFGIPIEQIVGSEIKDIIGETGWHKIKPYMDRAMLGEEIHYDFHMPYKTGKQRWIHVNYVPVRHVSGQVKGIVALVVDISEIRAAQQQINLLNEKLQYRISEMQAIFATAPIGLAITEDLQGLNIRGNPALEQMLNLPPHSELSLQGIKNKPYRLFKEGEELPIDLLPMQRGIRGEKTTNQLLDIHCNDGKTFSVLVNVRPLLNQDNSVRGAIGAFLDVTTLIATESALRQSQEQLSLAQQAGALGIFDYNLETGVLQWDHRLRELWGLEPETPITFESCKLGAYPEDRLKISDAMARALDPNGRGEYQVEYRILRPTDQRTFWIAAFGKTTFANDKPVRLVGFAQDITERKLAEEKLRDTELRVALALDELKAGYWDWNLQDESVYFSPVWKQQLGYAEAELPNRFEVWEQHLHPDDRQTALDTVNYYLKGKLPTFEMEFRLRHKDGSYRNIHSRGALLVNDHAKPIRMVGIHLDITEFKQAKRLKKQQKLLDETSELLVASQTAIAIAHDLNQPLNAVGNFADAAVAMLKTGNAKADVLAYALESCSEQAQRAGKVIPQLIGVLNKSVQIDINESIDINALIAETVSLVKNSIFYDQFIPQLNLQSGLPRVIGSRLQLQKVLYNLIQNGFDAMIDIGNSDGILSIKVSRQAASTGYLEIIIRDQGKGVTDTVQLKKLFQPFYSTKKTGLGIGLAICQDLIKAHGGEIWAEQNPDCGLSLHFTLPLVE